MVPACGCATEVSADLAEADSAGSLLRWVTGSHVRVEGGLARFV